MAEAAVIRVMIVDDHPVVRSGLSGIINAEPGIRVIATADDGQQALEFYRRIKPDVILMDLYMPQMGGVDAIRAIRREFPDARVVVLTTFDGDENIHNALEAGALSYLLKDSFAEEIIRAIRAAHAGQKMIPPEIARQLAARLPGNELTPKELECLKLIARGMNNREIASELHITENTVKSHINAVLGKLAVSDRTQAALVALQRGFVKLP